MEAGLSMDPRRPTSADVAARAGVSRATVSFVLNERADVKIRSATRLRVIEAANELGYHPNAPARQLAGGSSLTLGLVLLQTPEQVAGDALLAETLRGLSSAARAAGYRVLVESIVPGDGGYSDILRTRRAEGLVISGPRSDDATLEALAGERFPIVLQGSLPGLAVPSVDVDNVAGARQAVEHLLGLGHRRIGCVTNAPLAYTAARDRLDGYRQALEAAGIGFDEGLVTEGEFDAPSGHRAMTRLLGTEGMTAVFVASDVVALGAMGALREAGLRVPEDVSVVGFDNIPLAAYVDPPLTTVRIPAFELGLVAGQALVDRVARRPVADRTLLPLELVVRASTAPLTRATEEVWVAGLRPGRRSEA
jgi:LacI family transcriptional regulator